MKAKPKKLSARKAAMQRLRGSISIDRTKLDGWSKKILEHNWRF